MKKPALVLFHRDADGMCAAWVARKYLPRDTEFRDVQYKEPPPAEEEYAGRPLYVLDFSFDVETMRQMKERAAQFVVLDHHKTAEAAVIEVGGVYDVNRSGAMLAWDYFDDDGRPAPEIVRYVQDRDLWRWELPFSPAINAAIASYPLVLGAWDELARRVGDLTSSGIIGEGQAILRYEAQLVDRIVKGALPYEAFEGKIWGVNCPVLASEVGHVLAQRGVFAFTWSERKYGVINVELRSAEDGVDVGAIAKRYGGGGHAHAAGFATRELPFVRLTPTD
jgi:oligoribonuclease NrnB/cAMP/cGMP phosphodiesterase (DHH superfamily)